jgi:hypothetical protein
MRDYLGNTHISFITTFRRDGKVLVRPRISWKLGGQRQPTAFERFMKCIEELLEALSGCGRSHLSRSRRGPSCF